MSNGTDTPLSTLLARHLFLPAILAAGAHAPLTLLFQTAHLSFRLYTASGLLLVLAALAATVVALRRQRWSDVRRDWPVVAGLLLLALLSAGLALVTHTPADDDFYYVSNAVHFLQNPDQGMDFSWHFFRGSEGEILTSYNQGTSMAFDYFRAAAAAWLNLDYLVVYYPLSFLSFGLLLPLGLYLLVSRFTGDTSRALAGTVLSLALLLLLTQRNLLPGCLLFGHLQMGKVAVLAIGLPLFAAFSIDYLRRPTPARWLALFFLVAAACGMSASAALLLPLLSVCLFVAALVTQLVHPAVPRWWRTGLGYLASGGYAAGYLLFLFYQLRIRQGASDPFAVAYDQPGAPFKFHVFLHPFPVILFCLSLLATLWLSRGRRQLFLGVWTLAVILLLLDPLTVSLVIDRLVPQNIYWRIFYLLPFPLLAAVAGMALWQRLDNGRLKIWRRAVLFVLLALAVTHYGLDLRQRKELQLSKFKLDYRNLRDARQVAGVAPPGLMLAPPELFDLIPMVAAGHPQLNVLFHDGRFVLEENQWTLRTGAANFAGGKAPFETHFVRLVMQGLPEVIVLRDRAIKRSSGDLDQFLRSRGYTHREEAGEYLVYWRSIDFSQARE